jgi:hypothetical protein
MEVTESTTSIGGQTMTTKSTPNQRDQVLAVTTVADLFKRMYRYNVCDPFVLLLVVHSFFYCETIIKIFFTVTRTKKVVTNNGFHLYLLTRLKGNMV